jgi:tetratricopeptide (TPR) repeat protein
MNEQELKEFFNKGLLAFEKQNYDYAIDIFTDILSCKYDHWEARHYLHLALQKKHPLCNSNLAKKLIHSAAAPILNMQADNLLKKNDPEGALLILEKILLSNPYDTSALKKISDIFLNKNLVQHAINNLEEAKLGNPNDITVLKKLGEIYLKKEDYQNAKANYDAILKINPNDMDSLKSLKNLDALGTIKREFGS